MPPVKGPKRCIFEFTCQCSAKILFQNELKDHYFKCDKMKAHYQDLFNIIHRYYPKDLQIEQKQLLNAVIDMFSNEMFTNTMNEISKRGMQGPQTSPCSQSFPPQLMGNPEMGMGGIVTKPVANLNSF